MKTGKHFSQNQKSNIGIRTPSKSNTDQWNLSAEYIHCIGPEQQEYGLYFFATWLVRVILRRTDVEANTSLPPDDSEKNALTSHPNNCTVGVPSSCNTGGSNK
ncbi:MAG: hypothetical protein P9X24_07330 [Candidatus Hatepunaea meridiana]|nr:hypothetical protein [Candidatus Hatepunaea meridiana]